MNDVNWEMHFTWTDGKGVSYTNWAKGHPTAGPSGRYSFMDEVVSTFTSLFKSSPAKLLFIFVYEEAAMLTSQSGTTEGS